ncbi:oligopeptide ABC transporter permease OppB [soil metagenome]
MLRYACMRLLGGVPTLLILIALAFFLMRAAPGGPFDTEQPVPPAVRANLERAYHLDESLPQQFGRYLARLAHGDFGPSFQYPGYTVTDLIRAGFPVSLRIGALAMLLALVAGVAAGAFAALRHNRAADTAVMTAAMTGISVPNFVIAPLLILVFAVHLGWLPGGGYGDGSLRYLVLPVVALALPQLAYIARLTRGSMVEVLQSPFIRTARAKGLPACTIVTRHALKPALLPVVSYLGPATAGIVTGSVVIEQIFGIPGLGRFFVQGALNRDYTLVLGVVVFYGALILILNLVVDLLYAVLDPRVRAS